MKETPGLCSWREETATGVNIMVAVMDGVGQRIMLKDSEAVQEMVMKRELGCKGETVIVKGMILLHGGEWIFSKPRLIS